MKYHLIIALLFFCCSLFAQQKGATPINQQPTTTNQQTRAVVIGISDYQNLTDLQYADKDAKAFAVFLQSPAGGNVPLQNIRLLTNEQATGGVVNMELYWLLQDSKPGDRAIIYFSGHGDMEAKMVNQLGFLLCWDSQSFAYFSGGSVQVTNLQEIVSTLTQVNQSEVLLITDACRAGKLAGSAINGTGATTANLQNFTNAAKILSCQPNEFSLEGKQWGGGRGAFSYHLVNGLYGMADSDKDLRVKLREIGRYLEDHVPAEAAPHQQNPLVIGDREALVAMVDEGLLAWWESEKTQSQPEFSSGDMRGIVEQVLAQADTAIHPVYEKYLAAVEEGNLLSPEGASANDFYEKLIREPGIQQMHGMLTRNFVAALVDDAQQAINRYLQTDSLEMEKRFGLDSSYFLYPKYLDRATELLGENHYLYKNMKARQYYFEGVQKRMERDRMVFGGQISWGDSICRQLTFEDLRLQKIALDYEDKAAFIYHEIAMLNHNMGINMEEAYINYRKSSSLSPTWGLTLTQLGYVCEQTGRLEEAAEVTRQALEIAPHYRFIYSSLAGIYMELGQHEEAGKILQAGLRRFPNDPRIMNSLAEHYYETGAYEKADSLYGILIEQEHTPLNVLQQVALFYTKMTEPEIVEKICRKALAHVSTGQYAFAFNNFLSFGLEGQGKTEEALAFNQSMLEACDPNSASYNYWLSNVALVQIDLGQKEEGIANLRKVLESNPDDVTNNINMGRGYLKINRPGEAAPHYEKALQAAKKTKGRGFNSIIYELVWTHAWEGETGLALQWLETILKEGYDDFHRLQRDRGLAEVRKKKRFEELMVEYFPDQRKN